MTLTLILAIVAGVMLSAFCILCLLALKKCQRENQELSEQAKTLEARVENLSRESKTALKKDDDLKQKIEEELKLSLTQTLEQTIDAKLGEELKKKILSVSKENPPIAKQDEAPAALAKAEMTVEEIESPDLDDGFDEIELDDIGDNFEEIDLEDIDDDFNEIEDKQPMQEASVNNVPAEAPVENTPEEAVSNDPAEVPQQKRMEYDKAKSGKQYTGSELNDLIRM